MVKNANLEDESNYNKKYDTNINQQLSKYMAIINEFVHQIDANIKLSNKEYKKFIIIKGLETLLHVFKIILLYTKNLELTFYNSKKALYYYIEFISQIGEETHEFLKLTPKDAILFVYKKTIFTINENHIKNFKSLKNDILKIEIFENLTSLHLKIFLNKLDLHDELTNIADLFQETLKFVQLLINIVNNNSLSLTNSKLNILQKLSLILKIDIETYYGITKKLNKDMIDIELINFNKIISELSSDKSSNKKKILINNIFINSSSNCAK